MRIMQAVLGGLLIAAMPSARPTWAASDAVPASSRDSDLHAAVTAAHRSAAFVARDVARHPEGELSFFGLRPSMSVVEIWPGGGYWTEILAPYLSKSGVYTVAIASRAKLKDSALGHKLEGDPKMFGAVHVAVVGKDQVDLGPDESADRVLSFRNLHNWMAGGYAPQMFSAFFHVLKHGGILGIEDHRGQRDIPQDPQAKDGYVREDAAIKFAEAAGFVLDGRSDINANPRDTANWPKGVWTLPPDFAMGAVDRDRYAAIGEADNFVLRFRRP